MNYSFLVFNPIRKRILPGTFVLEHYTVNPLHMESLTVDIKDPKAKGLLEKLADLGLINIRPPGDSWVVRWQKLAATLPNVREISEQEIQAVRAGER